MLARQWLSPWTRAAERGLEAFAGNTGSKCTNSGKIDRH